MMTILKTAAAMALMGLAGWAPLPAQESERDGAEVVRVEDGAGGEGGPVAVVAHFLGLTPEQAPLLVQALGEREQALGPILQGIAMREQRIRELIATGGSPAEIGVLVVLIHQLRQQAENVQAVFLARVEAFLDPEQRVRWQQVRLAARLQPVVPAFQALRML
jgi:hypothetical protein